MDNQEWRGIMDRPIHGTHEQQLRAAKSVIEAIVTMIDFVEVEQGIMARGDAGRQLVELGVELRLKFQKSELKSLQL